MSLFELVVVIIVGISALVYTGLLLSLFVGWLSLPWLPSGRAHQECRVSIVIAARNEAAHIRQCLETISRQQYPLHLIDIIIVDDNSEDRTREVVNAFTESKPEMNVTMWQLSATGKSGKKAAVAYGVAQAQTSLILTTDADCMVPGKWVSAMVNAYQSRQPKIICGTVNYAGRRGLFQKFQALDFLSLIAAGAGATGLRKAFMGNAANMAFEKQVFEKLCKQRHDYELASGDDVFLIQEVQKHYGSRAVCFLKNNETMVFTEPKATLDDMIMQRIRWATKARAYKNFFPAFTAAAVLDFNFCITALCFLSIINPFFVVPLACLYGVKIIVDAPLLLSIMKFMHQLALMKHYLWIQLLYPFYLTYTGFVSVFTKHYQWKDRRVS